jgi:hypothetical protein
LYQALSRSWKPITQHGDNPLGPRISEGRKSKTDKNQPEQKQNDECVESKGDALSEATFQSESDENQHKDD